MFDTVYYKIDEMLILEWDIFVFFRKKVGKNKIVTIVYSSGMCNLPATQFRSET